MHELSLADAIVQICRGHARGRRVVTVEMRIGRLRQVVPDALEFAFALVAQGTELEGAELAIEDVPVRVTCRTCAAETEVEAFPLVCWRCGGLDVEVVAGEEFYVDSLEIEDAPLAAARR
jgi:hydrogenase nickel incorporation protein HypA/HybF